MFVAFLVTLTIAAAVCIAYRRSVINFVKFRSKLSKLPEVLDIAFPLIGHSYLFVGQPSEFFHYIATETNKVVEQSKTKVLLSWLGPVPLVTALHPETVQVILKSSKHIKKSYVYRFLHPWLGTGLLTSEGDKWKQRRRLITPSFHFNILQDFLETINEQSSIMTNKISKQYEAGKQVDIGKAITMCALDIICETAMGQSVNAQTDEDSAYVKAIYRMSDIIQLRQKTPMLWWDFAFKRTKLGREHDQMLNTLQSFTRKVIAERMTTKNQAIKVTKKMAFLDMLMHAATEDGVKLSLQDIQEEVDTFMFEGHDTTAAAMTWALYLLGRYPRVQERVQKELVEVFGRDMHRSATMDDLKKLVYLEQVIKEALRLFPSVPLFGRVTTEDCEMEGYTVPAGVQIILFAYFIHHHPEVWEDPYSFDPDRFTVENCARRHPFAYIPFSAGPRNCIGQRFALLEEKVILSSLLRRFVVTSHDKREDVKMAGELILRPAEPLNITLKQI